MVLNQETQVQPAKKSFPLKPKHQDSTSTMKTLQKKPAIPSDLARAWSELNTPPMFDEIYSASADEILPDTEPFQEEDINDVWGNLNCIPPAEAEGVVLFEAMVPTTDENEIEFDPLSHLISGEPFQFLTEQDVIEQSLFESGLDFTSICSNSGFTSFCSNTDLIVAPVIPEPIASTSVFLSEIVQPVEQEPLNTIETSELKFITSPTVSESPADQQFTPSSTPPTTLLPFTSNLEEDTIIPHQPPSLLCGFPPTPSTTEDDSKDDPTWSPESLQELYQASTSKATVYAKKTKLHTVTKPSMKATKPSTKRKPGRPERQEPFIITEVPSRRCMNVSEEELQGLKYRRMRDLNNKASKDCRARRKNKQAQLEEELEQLEVRNRELREKLAMMQEQAAYYSQQQ